jgi:hypothetical protein
VVRAVDWRQRLFSTLRVKGLTIYAFACERGSNTTNRPTIRRWALSEGRWISE